MYQVCLGLPHRYDVITSPIYEMRRKIEPKDLKYRIRERHVAQCTILGMPLNWGEFYKKVAEVSGSHWSRIQRLSTCRRDSELIATADELSVLAALLNCAATDLAAEAAERVVAV